MTVAFTIASFFAALQGEVRFRVSLPRYRSESAGNFMTWTPMATST